MTANYTAEQLGEIVVKPLHLQVKRRYSLIVIQPDNNQVVVIEPCSWDVGRERVEEMILRGVDPHDIRFTFRDQDCLDTDGLPLQPVRAALWLPEQRYKGQSLEAWHARLGAARATWPDTE